MGFLEWVQGIWREVHRAQGEFPSQPSLLRKHASQARAVFPRFAGGGGSWLWFSGQLR
jgi:anti-sigma factor RsiW